MTDFLQHFDDFHFLRPWWLLGLLLLPLALRFLGRPGDGSRDWAEHVEAPLRPFVLTESVTRGSRRLGLLATLVAALSLLALAGPAWERLPAPAYRDLSPLVIVLDLSSLMGVQDLKPSRMERARYKIHDLLEARKEGQTALIVYADDAFVVTPLTDDVATIEAQLNALSPGIMPADGSHLSIGLVRAGTLVLQAGQSQGDLLVVTAGALDDRTPEIISSLRSAGLRISVLGVASPEGAPIPQKGGGFRRNGSGSMEISRLDVKTLWGLAQKGGGIYRTLDSEGTRDEAAILEFLKTRSSGDMANDQALEINQWREGGLYLLPFILLLSALMFRRGWLGAILWVLVLAHPESARSETGGTFWSTPDQKGQKAFDQGRFEEALESFKNAAWKGAAAFRAGNFEEALKAFEGAAEDPSKDYNRGNALAREGKLEEALKAYDAQLSKTPKDEDTLYNRKIVEDALKNQPPPPKDDSKSSKDKDKDKNSDGKGDSKKPDPDGKSGNDQNPPGKNDPDQNPRDPQGQGKENQKPPEDSGSPQPEPQDPQGPEGKQPDAQGNPPEEPPKMPPENSPPGQGAGSEDPQKEAPEAPPAPKNARESDESSAQWLRRIPDDPGGLLRRKFLYQSQTRKDAPEKP